MILLIACNWLKEFLKGFYDDGLGVYCIDYPFIHSWFYYLNLGFFIFYYLFFCSLFINFFLNSFFYGFMFLIMLILVSFRSFIFDTLIISGFFWIYMFMQFMNFLNDICFIYQEFFLRLNLLMFLLFWKCSWTSAFLNIRP